jgi:predicted flavoprotein YhiN
MGASWLEIESLLKKLDEVAAFPHAEALMPVTRARDTVAETAMLVSRAGISGDPALEVEAQVAMARARVTLHEAEVAVRRAHEAVIATQTGCDRARRLIEEARALRARDGGPDRRATPRPGAVERRAATAPPEAP